jgi:hypothetical protein
MISKATRFATHASQREDYYVDLGTQAIRLRLEPGERRRAHSPANTMSHVTSHVTMANVTVSHIDTGDVLLTHGGG